VKLGREAAEKCLERAGLKADEIDLIITVSCTGFMIPSLGARLINLMGFRSNVRRMPFTELGCAARAMVHIVVMAQRHPTEERVLFANPN
jgi:alkylresorcinol/alkylpyrone synthase